MNDLATRVADGMGMDTDAMSAMKIRAKELLQAARQGVDFTLTEEDRLNIDLVLRTMMADILDVDIEDITDEVHLADELGMDSLAFLELFDEAKETFGIEMDVNVAAKYAQDHPVEHYGEFKEQMFFFLEKPDLVFKELGLNKDELLSAAIENIDTI